MSEQNNTKQTGGKQNDSRQNADTPKPKLLRVVCIELKLSKASVLQFVPSVYLAEIEPLLADADEVNLRFRINRQSDDNQ